MGSSRLPGKVMKPIGEIPLIGLLISRLSKSQRINQIIIATSDQAENRELVDYVSGLGFDVFRGSENDVLDRFHQAAKQFNADVIVRITGDCPLIDPILVDTLIDKFLSGNTDYFTNTQPPTFPDGLDIEVFSYKALEIAAIEANSKVDREHVTPYIRNSDKFKLGNYKNSIDLSNERWTVDEIADFRFSEAIFEHFSPNIYFSWIDVLNLKGVKPEIFYCNKDINRNEGFMKSKLNEIELRNISNFQSSIKYRQTIHNLIPGGAHTYSKGDDQFPELSPAAIAYGKGAHIWDVDGNEYLDCPMGLTSVSLGHAYPPVLDAVKKELENGVNFQRPSMLEKEMAESFLDLVPSHDRIKFAKNGSIVTTAAVKLARAKTGRKYVVFPKDHPFYSYDDWFIGTTPCNKGVPEEFTALSLTFQSYDIPSLKALFEAYPDQIACVITEPEKSDFRTIDEKRNYLTEIIKITQSNGALFIMDEMVTGFKTAFPGTMTKWDLEPDMATWGKGIANGFSFCALTGKKDVMDLGGILQKGQEKVFLISTTHGGETHTLAAALATIDEFKNKDVIAHIHSIGNLLIKFSNQVILDQGLEEYISVTPTNWLIGYTFSNEKKQACNGMRTLVMQEMIKHGILFQGAFVPCFSHSEDDILYFIKAFNKALSVYKEALQFGYDKYLTGEPVKAVFRRIL